MIDTSLHQWMKTARTLRPGVKQAEAELHIRTFGGLPAILDRGA
jgi:hypothetical protein